MGRTGPPDRFTRIAPARPTLGAAGRLPPPTNQPPASESAPRGHPTPPGSVRPAARRPSLPLGASDSAGPCPTGSSLSFPQIQSGALDRAPPQSTNTVIGPTPVSSPRHPVSSGAPSARGLRTHRLRPPINNHGAATVRQAALHPPTAGHRPARWTERLPCRPTESVAFEAPFARTYIFSSIPVLSPGHRSGCPNEGPSHAPIRLRLKLISHSFALSGVSCSP